MKPIVAILCALSVLAGCAGPPKPAAAPAAASAPAPALAASQDFDSVDFDQAQVAAAALVFDPPVAANEPPLRLARAPRQQGAFVAYDQVFTTYFYLRLDDRQKLTPDGISQRRVISETFGISRR